MDPDIGFETEAVDYRYEATDTIQRCPCYGAVGKDMASPPGENGVEGGDRVGGSGHGDGVKGFEEARGGGQEGRVQSAAGCGNDLTAPTGDAVGGERDVGQLEPGVADCCPN